MAKPRVFISSTFYDLKQIRADLDKFIEEQIGYEAVRNETGKIPYGNKEKLEQYCYNQISGIEILIGIIGGKFGTPSDKDPNHSITQFEIKTAIDQEKQVYIFIEKNVLSEYQTYRLNKNSTQIKYYYADDPKIYTFIEELYALPKNNVIHPFEEADDITHFLKEQWAGLFRELLISNTEREGYKSMSSKVNEITHVTNTLKTYLEEVLENVEKEKGAATELIQREKERLANLYRGKVVRNVINDLYFIDKKGFYHLLPDEETAEFLDPNYGQNTIQSNDLERNYKKGNNLESVLSENAKLVWVDKTHIFIILDGKRYHVPSWDNLYTWNRTNKEKYIDILTEDLHRLYPDGR